MQYPHERDEQKELLNQLINRSASYRSVQASLALIIGSIIILSALLQLLVSSESLASTQWIFIWIGTFAVAFLAAIVTLILFNKKATIPLANKRQKLLFRNLVPTLIAGGMIGFLIPLYSPQSLPISSIFWIALTGISLIHFSTYAVASIRNLGIAQLIIAISFMTLLVRHQELSISASHLANIILIVGLGLSSITFGLWTLLIKK